VRRALLLALALAACEGTTGFDHVRFAAEASGPDDATGGPLEFRTNRGFHVVLTKAVLHVGGVYLNQTVPLSGKQQSGCYLPGIYVAQVLGAVDVDLLSGEPVAFPVDGEGIALDAHVGEVWLTGGRVDAADDRTVILAVEGTADKDGREWPFRGAITIGRNRQVPSADPTLPSLHPLCLERIASAIPVDLTPQADGKLRLTVDPRGLFVSVDFSALPQVSESPPRYAFSDAPDNAADLTLYKNLHARSGVYAFTWEEAP
jgi:hypothetical protein